VARGPWAGRDAPAKRLDAGNPHALAREFVPFDDFYVDREVSHDLRAPYVRAASGERRYNRAMVRRVKIPVQKRSAAACLAEAERLFADFRVLTPYRFKPFVRTFTTFGAYERWRRAQTNPWYR
jgi:hypothetical protein